MADGVHVVCPRCDRITVPPEAERDARFGIRGTPALILFKDGREADRMSGALDHPGLLDWVRARL
ncbi:MAG TPA: thioredoxin family protein [Gammaproteobacteria bacterium]|nr:thioredoxin family protein [Gammaproteobacteria bacterium]